MNAEPLYGQGLNIAGLAVHNVVYAATENDSVYAFDADGTSSPPLWQESLLPAGGQVLNAPEIGGCSNISPLTGIRRLRSSTPQRIPCLWLPATPAVSANGSTNGLLWMLTTVKSSTAVLHVYDAANLSRELYNSDQNKSRDQAGQALKFAVPTVANGKVYIGTATELDGYGLLPQP